MTTRNCDWITRMGNSWKICQNPLRALVSPDVDKINRIRQRLKKIERCHWKSAKWNVESTIQVLSLSVAGSVVFSWFQSSAMLTVRQLTILQAPTVSFLFFYDYKTRSPITKNWINLFSFRLSSHFEGWSNFPVDAIRKCYILGQLIRLSLCLHNTLSCFQPSPLSSASGISARRWLFLAGPSLGNSSFIPLECFVGSE